jgi:hypothetical protein
MELMFFILKLFLCDNETATETHVFDSSEKKTERVVSD